VSRAVDVASTFLRVFSPQFRFLWYSVFRLRIGVQEQFSLTTRGEVHMTQVMMMAACVILGLTAGVALPFPLLQDPPYNDGQCEPNGTGGGNICHGEIEWSDQDGKFMARCHKISCLDPSKPCPDPTPVSDGFECRCEGSTPPAGCHAKLRKDESNKNDKVKECVGSCPPPQPPNQAPTCKRSSFYQGEPPVLTKQCCICRTGTEDTGVPDTGR
jgi:hypothetical protein